jgi:hypothetical protein
MSFRIKVLSILCGIFVSTQALCFEPCGEGLAGAQVSSGLHTPTQILAPDLVSTIPGKQLPESLIELGWHNLKKPERPVLIKCFYKNGQRDHRELPPDIDGCSLLPGLRMICK